MLPVAKLSLPQLTLLVLAVPVCGQTLVVPPQFAGEEAPRISSRFGVYAEMRLQWVEGELPSGVRVFREIGLRQDAGSGALLQYGRRHDLRVYLSDGDHKTQSGTFTTNVLSRPSRMFGNTFSLPQRKLPWLQGRPAPWDSAYRIGFSTTYVHRGLKDLLIDMEFRNGVLQNSLPWSGTREAQYLFDAPPNAQDRTAGLRLFHPGGTVNSPLKGCVDRSRRFGRAPYTVLNLIAHGPAYPTASRRNRVATYIYGYPFDNVATVFSVIGVKADPAGTVFPGVSCQKLFVDLTRPFFTTVGTKSTVGSALYNSFLGGSNVFAPYVPALAGQELVVQSAWTDTVDRSVKLSIASQTSYPHLAVPLRRRTTYAPSVSARTGVVSALAQDFPVIRYR